MNEPRCGVGRSAIIGMGLVYVSVQKFLRHSAKLAIGGGPKKHNSTAQNERITPLRQLRQLAECLRIAGKNRPLCQQQVFFGGGGHFSRKMMSLVLGVPVRSGESWQARLPLTTHHPP